MLFELGPLAGTLDDAARWCRFGLDRLLRGQPEAAATLFKEAIKRDRGRSSELLYNAGTAALEAGKLERAVRWLNKALKLDGCCVRSRFNLAIARYRQGRLSEALGLLDEVIRLDPAFAPAYLHAALFRSRAGQRREAWMYWMSYARIEPDGAYVEFALAELQSVESWLSAESGEKALAGDDSSPSKSNAKPPRANAQEEGKEVGDGHCRIEKRRVKHVKGLHRVGEPENEQDDQVADARSGVVRIHR